MENTSVTHCLCNEPSIIKNGENLTVGVFKETLFMPYDSLFLERACYENVSGCSCNACFTLRMRLLRDIDSFHTPLLSRKNPKRRCKNLLYMIENGEQIRENLDWIYTNCWRCSCRIRSSSCRDALVVHPEIWWEKTRRESRWLLIDEGER